MSLIFIRKAKIMLQQKRKQDIYKVTAIDNTALSYNNEVINYKMKDTQLQIGPHVWDMWFNITLINKHDVVLRLLWLHDVDLKISF